MAEPTIREIADESREEIYSMYENLSDEERERWHTALSEENRRRLARSGYSSDEFFEIFSGFTVDELEDFIVRTATTAFTRGQPRSTPGQRNQATTNVTLQGRNPDAARPSSTKVDIETLPEDEQVLQALSLSVHELKRLCFEREKVSRLICGNPDFWASKILADDLLSAGELNRIRGRVPPEGIEELYVELLTKKGIYTYGSERFAQMRDCVRYAAKINDGLLIDYFTEKGGLLDDIVYGFIQGGEIERAANLLELPHFTQTGRLEALMVTLEVIESYPQEGLAMFKKLRERLPAHMYYSRTIEISKHRIMKLREAIENNVLTAYIRGLVQSGYIMKLESRLKKLRKMGLIDRVGYVPIKDAIFNNQILDLVMFYLLGSSQTYMSENAPYYRRFRIMHPQREVEVDFEELSLDPRTNFYFVALHLKEFRVKNRLHYKEVVFRILQGAFEKGRKNVFESLLYLAYDLTPAMMLDLGVTAERRGLIEDAFTESRSKGRPFDQFVLDFAAGELAEKGNRPLLQILLDAGASAGRVVYGAIKGNHLDLIKEFLPVGGGAVSRYLNLAASEGKIEIFELLLRDGYGRTISDLDLARALESAANFGYRGILEIDPSKTRELLHRTKNTMNYNLQGTAIVLSFSIPVQRIRDSDQQKLVDCFRNHGRIGEVCYGKFRSD